MTSNKELKGITVNGKPLKTVLDDQVAGDIAKLRSRIINKMEHNRHHRSTRLKYAEQTRRVSKRVVHLTDRQIRKEYGPMSKPHQTEIESILEIILQQGPITATEIAKILCKKTTSISGTMSRINKALGSTGLGWISRKPFDKTFEYRAVQQFSAESGKDAINAYLAQSRQQAVDAAPIKLDSTVKQAVSKAVSEALGIEVKITGEIKVLFGFVKS